MSVDWSVIGDTVAYPVEIATVTGDPGPETLAVLAGVHGDEPEGVIAARRLANRMATMRFSGTVLIVPVACPGAFAAGTRTSSVDGIDLARTFPGDERGSDTERVAHLLTEEVIARSTMLVDLHSAGKHYEMPLFAGAFAGDGETGARSASAAVAFGAPLVWFHDRLNPGRSISVAAERGIPAIYVETGGGGNLRPADLDAYVEGTLRVMQEMSMLSDVGAAAAERDESPQWAIRGGSGDIDAGLVSPFDGWCVPLVQVGQRVTATTIVAELVGEDGNESVPLLAGRDGSVLMLRRSARVSEGTLLALVGPVPQAMPAVPAEGMQP